MERASAPGPVGTLEIFLTQITFAAKCTVQSEEQMFYFAWLTHITHCIPRNYGLTPDGDRITLWIHRYVEDCT